jgi:cardiolipin synthase
MSAGSGGRGSGPASAEQASTGPGSDGPANADWASRIAEHLPASDVLQLASATAGGEDAVRSFRGQATAPVVREACDQVLTRLGSSCGTGGQPAYVAGLLAGAAAAVQRARKRQSLDVVWTGPESGIATSRLTAAAVTGLIGQAQRDILLVSYATHPEPDLGAALTAAAARGVTITLLAERHADNPSYVGADTPFVALPAIRLHWPASQRPRGAALHAKIIVVDEETALVGSANLTSRAMENNLECGILIRGGPVPKAIRDHIVGLQSRGYLRRL